MTDSTAMRYAIANIDGIPDRPGVFVINSYNPATQSYLATCVSIVGVNCLPGPLSSADILADYTSRGAAFEDLSARVHALKTPAQHELPGILPAPVEATAQMLADVPIMRFFHYAHLPDALREVSKPFAELALSLVNKLPPNAERTTALRKLLEAKDCAVRASLPTGYGEKI